MPIFHGNSIPTAAAGSDDTSYSLRFVRAANHYLERTHSVSSSYTTSCWVKRGEIDGGEGHSGVSNMRYVYRFGAEDHMGFKNDDKLNVEVKSGGAGYMATNRRMRDSSAWCHIVVINTGGGNANSQRLFVNGVEHDYSDGGSYARTGSGFTHNNVNFRIGSHESTVGSFDGYIADFHFIDGQAKSVSDFGEAGDYGEWKPKAYEGTYGSNGFYLEFANPNTAYDVLLGSGANVTHKTIGSGIGASSLYFDGTGDYLSIPDHSDFQFDGDYTVECWFNTSSTAGGAFWSRHSSHAHGLFINRSTAGKIRWQDDKNGIYTEVGSGLNDGAWHHIALVRNGSGSNNLKLYIDGTLTSTQSGSTAQNFVSSLGIGYYVQANQQYLDGYIDEFRISDTARYTADFTPSTTAFTSDANTQLLIHSDTTDDGVTFTDSSSNAHAITVVGDLQHSAAQYKFGNSSIAFDGSGDYISIPDHADIQFGTSDFTIEFWFRTNGTGNSYAWELAHKGPPGTDSLNWWLGNNGSQAALQVFTDAGTVDLRGGPNLADQQWHHLALVRNGSSWAHYADGTAIDTQTLSGSVRLATGSPFNLGVCNANGAGDFNGHMDELRISNTARYTSNFTPSTTAFTDDEYTKYLIHSDSVSQVFTDSSSNAHTITAAGDTTHRKLDSGIGATSMYFDGNGDEIYIPHSDELAAPSGDFTMEFWFRPNTRHQAGLMSVGNTTTSGQLSWCFLMLSSGYISFYTHLGGAYVPVPSPADSIRAQQWNHVAAVRSGNTLTCYMNGVAGTPVTNSGAFTNYNTALRIGNESNGIEDYAGYIDEVRISNVARYTSNFTPSTTAFESDINTLVLIHSDAGQTHIGQGVGTPIGNMTDNGGLAASFDGNKDQQYGDNSVCENGNGPAYIGKDWGSGVTKTITGIKTWGNRDSGYGGIGAATSMFVYGSNSLPSGTTDGTLIATLYENAADVNAINPLEFLSGFDTTTAYRYHWLTITTPSVPTAQILMSEVEFYEGVGATTVFTDSSGLSGGLGHDSSGNGNHFTISNISSHDQVKDHPTTNFCTLNPIAGADSITYSESNLTASSAWYEGGHQRKAFGTFSIPLSGKWYWEWSGDGRPHSGFGTAHSQPGSPFWPEQYLVNLYPTGSYVVEGGALVTDNQPITGITANPGDIYGVAVNRNTDVCEWFVNGVSVGSFTMNAANRTEHLFPNAGDGASNHSSTQQFNFGQDSTFGGIISAGGNLDANGRGDFKYPVPEGHLALCSANLPEPTVKPKQHFNATLYTGTSGAQSITGVGFSPDLTILKRRSGISKSWMWTDKVRGAGKYLQSDGSGAENDDIQTVNSFDADGITLGTASPQQFNDSGVPHVLYSWNTNGTIVTNTQGSISAQVSANTAAGFSIITHSGESGNGTVGHGLSKAPNLVITKSRNNADQWRVGSIQSAFSMDFTDYLRLNQTGSKVDESTTWNDTAPTSTVISVGTDSATNHPGYTYVSYCFHNVEGYSKIGTFGGGTPSIQPFIYCGFNPSFVMIKSINRNAPWIVIDNVRDSQNAVSKMMYMNDTTTELTSHPGGASLFDFTSNGFKLRGPHGDGDINTSNGEYMYVAFAETPFKYSNAQ